MSPFEDRVTPFEDRCHDVSTSEIDVSTIYIMYGTVNDVGMFVYRRSVIDVSTFED